MTTPPVVILGAGGHARVLIDILLKNGVTIVGATDVNPELAGASRFSVRIIGDDSVLREHPPGSVHLVNALGLSISTQNRLQLFEKYKELGYFFASAIHPSVILGSDVILGEGVQMMAGAVIQPGAQIGANTIINTNASVDHDCKIGNHVHVAPGVTLSGGVHVGDGSHIGTGAKVIQNITIGSSVLVGAGAVVVKPVRDGAKILGVPAREVRL